MLIKDILGALLFHRNRMSYHFSQESFWTSFWRYRIWHYSTEWSVQIEANERLIDEKRFFRRQNYFIFITVQSVSYMSVEHSKRIVLTKVRFEYWFVESISTIWGDSQCSWQKNHYSILMNFINHRWFPFRTRHVYNCPLVLQITICCES